MIVRLTWLAFSNVMHDKTFFCLAAIPASVAVPLNCPKALSFPYL
jgi:hypothetical protein